GRPSTVRSFSTEHDDFCPPDGAAALEARLREVGVDAELRVHAGTGHAFMAPHDALGTRRSDLAEEIWPEVHSLIRAALAER
ncbi:MAG: dienelactone hydrolase family protein, partial [Ilumatobacter sp.]